MFGVGKRGGQMVVHSLFQALCLCTTWTAVVAASPQEASPRNVSDPSPILSTIQLPSLPMETGVAPSTVILTVTSLSSAGPILGSPPATPQLTPIGPPMEFTEEPLRPIPPVSTASVGDPSGHHEITEPNLTATASCRGCSPVIEISVSGWDPVTSPAAEQAGPSSPVPNLQPPPPPHQTTIIAGDSAIIVSQAPGGSAVVVDGSATIAPGETVTVGDRPVAVQTSDGKTHIIIGTSSIPILPSSPQPAGSTITRGPVLLSPIVLAGETLTANSASEFVIGSQTLSPGGHAITVSGTVISLLPSATVAVVNDKTTTLAQVAEVNGQPTTIGTIAVISGKTTTLSQTYGGYYTKTHAPFLTWSDHIYTPNAAGYYRLGPGTTLIPGGPPVTVSGTVVSLDASGTAAVFAGSTSQMRPVTTVVTWTMPVEGWSRWSSGWPSITGGPVPPQSTGKHSSAGVSGFVEGFFLLGVIGVGWLAVWL
ncbi:hypothetical protein GQ43DRAFT_469601 [Delitschia confertaspora ATCC 74209]|uniref:Uncharacterized protein n=1 Tax=Delitschia confertaspora ATCC 74209 TaxID=1513339 RepID=A0A9P4JV98_9PLEO|nr:hypothetical protein GQ43DRAFT_469601 [Delitschia confertaspora ATCC 74209]